MLHYCYYLWYSDEKPRVDRSFLRNIMIKSEWTNFRPLSQPWHIILYYLYKKVYNVTWTLLINPIHATFHKGLSNNRTVSIKKTYILNIWWFLNVPMSGYTILWQYLILCVTDYSAYLVCSWLHLRIISEYSV